MRFTEAYEGWEEGRLTQVEAALILGMSERNFRRHIDRYEADGLSGLLDKRLSQISHRKAATSHAFRVLKATSASSWEAIEFSRQQLVARAQPDRVANLEPAKRKTLQDEAREANIAYKILLHSRS
jgi:Winged helix-turn helix